MNLTNLISHDDLASKSGLMKKIFFYRICGTGMGAAACLLKEKGYEVEGGDTMFAPPMSTYLQSTGIPLHKLSDVDDKKLKEFDLIVVGNVVPRDSEDAKRVEESGVPFCSFPAALGSLVLKDFNVIGIAGTHGKTTTTYFFMQVFENLRADPGYFIGGVLEGRNSSKLGGGDYFFIESDEYDSAYFEKISKFRLYSLDHMIITSLEYDHADIFSSVEDIKNEFREALKDINGEVLYCSDYSHADDLKNEFHKKGANWTEYGKSSWTGPRIIEAGPEGTTFSVTFENSEHKFETNVVGVHNIFNLTPVVLFALQNGFRDTAINRALKGLKMVKRRQEVRGIYNGAIVIDDFAHHPTSIGVTVNTIKTAYPGKKVHVIFEPNSATARSSIFQEEYVAAFEEADSIFFTKPTRKTSAKNASDLDIDLLVKQFDASGKKSKQLENIDDLMKVIQESSSDDSVILVLSNGTCLGLWESDFVKDLQK